MAFVPVAALVVSSGAANASVAHVRVNAGAAALASLRHLMIGEHGTNHVLGGPAARSRSGPKKVTSGNWSGYADDGSAITNGTRYAGPAQPDVQLVRGHLEGRHRLIRVVRPRDDFSAPRSS